jgi:hypothetical protein
VATGVVRDATPGRYYLDLAAFAEYLESRRRRFATAWVILVALAIALSLVAVTAL